MATLEQAAEILNSMEPDAARIEWASEAEKLQVPPGPKVLLVEGLMLGESTVGKLDEEVFRRVGRSLKADKPDHYFLDYAIHEDPKPPKR